MYVCICTHVRMHVCIVCVDGYIDVHVHVLRVYTCV